ncbi:MAG: hypothetical protein EOP51_21230, partial [Sphingobacteriales bacterium]
STAIDPIGGPSLTCLPFSITLTHTLNGGVWSSATPAVATINAATGVLTPVSAGTTVITYAVTVGSCISTATKTITVNGVIPVSAPAAVCVGSTAALSPNSGGTWTSSNTAVATVNATTGIITGVASGTVSFTYTNSTCSATTTNVTVNTAPVITVQPVASRTVCKNVSTSFSVTATGGSLTYQWFKGGTPLVNGPNISGATSATLVINPTAASDSATYYCVVSNSCSTTATSNNAVLIVNTPSVAGDILNQQACSGSPFATVTLSNPNNALGTITYTWVRNNTATVSGMPSSGGGSTISGTLINSTGAPVIVRFTVYAQSSIPSPGGCFSDPLQVLVTVNSVLPGAVTGSQTICSGGDPAAFTSTAATGAGTITYQWQSNTTGCTGVWADIAGATSANYDAPSGLNITTYYRRVAVSTYNANACPVYSNCLVVNVNNIIASQISGSQDVCSEDPVAFTIDTSASGSGTLSYQWQLSTTNCSGPWTNIPGAVSATYDPLNTGATTFYQVVVTSTLNGVQCAANSNCVIVNNSTKTWNGSINNAWNTAGNWTPNGVPTIVNCVIIPNVFADPVIGGSSFTAYARNLKVLNGGRLDVDTSNTIVVENAVTVVSGGDFFIRNNASLVQIDDVPNAGSVKMNRITQPMYRYDYTYWNSPMMMGTYTLSDLSPNTLFDKYFSWIPTVSGGMGNWFGESPSAVMNPAKGYIIRAPQTYSTNPALTQPYAATFVGTPNNGTISIPISVGVLGASTTNDKMNLIGNPYPSAVNANAFLNNPSNAAVIGGTVYFWTHHTGPSAAFPNPFYGTFSLNYSPNGYASYNALGGTNTVPSGFGGTPPNGYIAAGQGFFVKGLASGAAIFTNDMRASGNNSVFFRTSNDAQESATEVESHRLWLNLADDNDAFSQLLIGYATAATNGIDRSFDGERMNSEGTSFYSVHQDTNLEIQGRALPFDNADLIPLGYTSPTEKVITIGIDHLDGLFENNDVFLEDKLLGIISDLKISPYSFASAAGTFNDRFVLRYT